MTNNNQDDPNVEEKPTEPTEETTPTAEGSTQEASVEAAEVESDTAADPTAGEAEAAAVAEPDPEEKTEAPEAPATETVSAEATGSEAEAEPATEAVSTEAVSEAAEAEPATEAVSAEATVSETAEAEPATEEVAETPAAEAPVTEEAAEAPVAEAHGEDEIAENPLAEDSDEDDEENDQGKSFEELLEQYDQFRSYRPGDIVAGTVVSLGEQEVLIDIGARVEGMIPATELRDKDGNFKVTDGEQLTVMVCRFNPDAQYIPLSFERARVSKVWDEIESIAEEEKMITGTIIEKVKGGFIVDVGVRAFLPTSQATLKPQKEYQDLLGQSLEFSILKIQRRRGNLILSRRDILQNEFEGKKNELFEKLVEGAELEGTVKNITDYGVFIDLGGLDGLLHITDMSWGRVTHPKDLVELGQSIKVKVLRFDREKEKVSLGLKQCAPDPWLSVAEKYPPGTMAKGKVLNLTSYGAFVEMEAGVEGMIHVSELSWTKKIRNPAQMLSKGQEVSVRVLDLDSDNRRVSLSLKQTEDNPWDSLAERFPVGSKVKGKVRNITDFGAFVEIEDGIDGLVHVSDFTWGDRNAAPADFVKKGEEVEVVILAVDTENRKVSLGIKQLEQDPWIDFTNHNRVNDIVVAPVSKVTEFGAFLKLSDHVEGLIRNAELRNKEDKLEEGQEVKALITRINHRERKVDLSVRKLHVHEERQAVLEYTRNNDSGGATMGDIMGEQLRRLMKE
ncbi:MAG: 30S ribosomal protein S1 [Acidobacteriota bacterium]|nr:30S ribosomal protein S1 [Acidobacteriota bacterium]